MLRVNSIYRWPLTQLCYAGICLVGGGVILAIGAANDGNGFGAAASTIGGLALLLGVLYVLVALWGLAKALMDDGPEEP